jgi:hypothetical protein
LEKLRRKLDRDFSTHSQTHFRTLTVYEALCDAPASGIRTRCDRWKDAEKCRER